VQSRPNCKDARATAATSGSEAHGWRRLEAMTARLWALASVLSVSTESQCRSHFRPGRSGDEGDRRSAATLDVGRNRAGPARAKVMEASARVSLRLSMRCCGNSLSNQECLRCPLLVIYLLMGWAGD